MEFSNIVEIIYKITATLGIILGLIGGYFHYFRGRTYKSRLDIGVQGESVLKDQVIYLRISAYAKNVGLSKTNTSKGVSTVRVWSCKSKDDNSESEMEEKRIGTYQIFEKHELIEPGETIDDHLLIPVPYENQIAFKFELRVVSNGHEWNTTNTVFCL
jgi:hypothetical protein